MAGGKGVGRGDSCAGTAGLAVSGVYERRPAAGGIRTDAGDASSTTRCRGACARARAPARCCCRAARCCRGALGHSGVGDGMRMARRRKSRDATRGRARSLGGGQCAGDARGAFDLPILNPHALP